MSAGLTTLALRSLRRRATAFTATFLTALLGSAMIGSFATQLETATGPVSGADAEALVIMGAVVGGWGLVIVLFSVASTVGINTAQRATELGLVRTIGATPRQVRRLVNRETLLVTSVSATLGALVAYGGGALLLAALRDAGMVAPSVEYGGGPASLSIVVAGVVLVSLAASTVAARRATRGPARLVLAEASADVSRMRWWRVAGALLLMGYGVAGAVVTVFVTKDAEDPYAAMQTSGSAAILVGVGLAALAPLWLRWAASLVPTAWLVGAPPYLAVGSLRGRPQLLAGVLAPVIVLTASATGILMLVGIDGRTLDGTLASEDAELITTLNYVVAGMIATFAAIMVVNGVAAMLAHRRAELVRLRLVGATPGQVRTSLLFETAMVAAVGVVLGTVASTATVLPFAYAREEGVLPDGQLWVPAAIAAAALALTMVSTRAALRRLASAPAAG